MIFVSYATEDREFVNRLKADLEQQGVLCSTAPEDLSPGTRFRDEIEKLIQHGEIQHSLIVTAFYWLRLAGY